MTRTPLASAPRSRSRAPLALLALAPLLLALLAFAGCKGGGDHEAAADADRKTDAAQTDGVPDAEIPGRWGVTPAAVRADGDLSAEQQRKIKELESLAYVSGSQPAKGIAGVTVHDRDRAQPGYNYYTSGHGPEAILMDMDGNVIHRWSYPFEKVWPDRDPDVGGQFWRRAHLYENGDILVIWEGMGMARLDAESNLIWANDALIHHDIDVGPDGTIYTLCRKAHLIPRIHLVEPILEDYLIALDPKDGHIIKKVSVLEAMEKAAPEDRKLLSRMTWKGKPGYGDIFHTNTVTLLDGSIADRIPAFAAGNILTSMRHLSTLAVVNLDEGKVLWTATGVFSRQHDPQILPNGHLILFDNRGAGRYSAIREYDPVTMKEVWSYVGTRANPFYTPSCGSVQRLANGNTLITESDVGHAFEITPAGEKVWEFWSPHRAGKDGEMIATLFDVVRIPPDFPLGWAQGKDEAAGKAAD